MTPFLFSPTPNDPFFPLLYQILQANLNFLRASCSFWQTKKLCHNFNIKFANFALKLHFCTLNDLQFWESTPKKIPFFWSPHRMTPFFQWNLIPNALYFRSLVGTCMSISYSSGPPPPGFGLTTFRSWSIHHDSSTTYLVFIYWEFMDNRAAVNCSYDDSDWLNKWWHHLFSKSWH